MIEVTKLNKKNLFVNQDLIRFIESAPDTVITFTDGQNMMVLDTPAEIIRKIINFRKECGSIEQMGLNIER